MPFVFIDHTADMGVRITAGTLNQLFEQAAEAFTAAICDLSEVGTVTTEEVSVTAPEVDLLLVDWLNELLWRFDAQTLLVRASVVTLSRESDRWRLRGTLSGERLDPGRHHIKTLIKGITYHRLSVAQTPDGWRALVVFDI